MVPYVRDIVGSIPITISVSGTAGVAGLGQLVAAGIPLDFYNLHYYGTAGLAYRTFQDARIAVGSAPLFVGETGYSTSTIGKNSEHYRDAAWWEAYQDQYFRTVGYAARAAALPPPAPWILSDIKPGAMPPSKAASNPAEYSFGLYRTDGTPKPAAAAIRTIFAGDPIDMSFNNGFEDTSPPGPPRLWSLWQSHFASFATDRDEHYSGAASARISHSSASKVGVPSFYLSPVKYIEPGQNYMASVWSKGRDATGATHIALAWFDANGKYLSTDASPRLPPGTTDWTQLNVTARAPTDAAYVQIHLVSANNQGTAWFDDVAFE
jgi:hypothetical protein